MQEPFISNLYGFIIINLTILSFIFIFKKSISNTILSMYIFAHVCVLSFCFSLLTSAINQKFFVFVCIPAASVGPLLYLYIRSLFLSKDKILSKDFLLHVFASLSMSVIFCILNFAPISFLNKSFYSFEILRPGDFPFYLKFYTLIHVPIYIGYSFFWFSNICKKQQLPKNINCGYAKNFLLSLIVFITFYGLTEFLQLFSIVSLFQIAVIAPVVVFMLFIFLVFYAVNNSPVFENRIVILQKPQQEWIQDHIPEDTQDAFFAELEQKINGAFIQKKLYLNPELTIKKLSEQINVPLRSLSVYINQEKQMNYTDFVNSFRVECAKKMLCDNSYRNYTIDAIGELSGFNSRASFYAIFKKHTGCTPKLFKTRILSELELSRQSV
jgi:AraC-like DNA-binding protein